MTFVPAGSRRPDESLVRSAAPARSQAIDQFRGLAILLMALADYLAKVQTAPAFLKHAVDTGYTVVDLIAPMFIFAIGLTFGASFRRRVARQGRWDAYSHFIARNLALIGLGYLLTLAGGMTGVYESTVNWGLLQAIGAASLIALVVIPLPPLPRALAGVALLAGYQFMLDRAWLGQVTAAPHNGPWGALSWAALLILATCIADLYLDPQRRRLAPWVSLFLVAAGLALTAAFPLSKDRATASYILLSLGLSSLVFLLTGFLVARRERGLPVLGAWGRNALLMYLLHGVVIGLFALPAAAWWYEQAAWWLVVLQAAFMLAVLSGVGVWLDRRRLYWTL